MNLARRVIRQGRDLNRNSVKLCEHLRESISVTKNVQT